MRIEFLYALGPEAKKRTFIDLGEIFTGYKVSVLDSHDLSRETRRKLVYLYGLPKDDGVFTYSLCGPDDNYMAIDDPLTGDVLARLIDKIYANQPNTHQVRIVDCSAKIDVIKGMQDTLGLERPGLRELKATVDGHNVLLCKEYEANEIEKIARYHGARASVEQLTTDF